ncbi:MAG TPA: hydantoinase B/oxoprolinase family protein, partial [Candidatus Dormibacteraeota bacterium]
ASQAVKQIIASFGDDPGIFEGDTFFANDPYTVAMHAPDVFMITPIYFNQRLVSWVVNFVHVTDIGGIDVGGFCPSAKESYQEGFSTKGLRIAHRGKVQRDVYDTFLNMIRDPGMTGLDLKSQMSANHVVTERMHGLYEDYGLETVDIVSEALIQDSERRLRRRLAELPDGVWQSRRYMDLPGRDWRLQVVAIKSGDRLTYDFTGTDEQADFPMNCQFWATKGAALAPLLPMLAWDLTWNEGVVRCLDIVAPEGSILNCRRPAPVSLNTISTIHAVNVLSEHLISKIFAASTKYRDRAMGGWLGSQVIDVESGRDKQGEYIVMQGGDNFGMAEGARAFGDGAGPGGHVVNVAQKMSNVEFEEQTFPKVFAFRRIVTDSGGPGKYRGGPAHEHAITPCGGATDEMHVVVSPGSGESFPGSYGINGGYPGGTTLHRLFVKSNASDLPPDVASIAGDAIDVRAKSIVVTSEDILYLRFEGGGGYGDPLDRDPAMVVLDVERKIVSAGGARLTYGVVLDANHTGVDVDATRARRLAIRTERLGRVPAVDTGSRHAVPESPYRINEYIQRTVDDRMQCTWCGTYLCTAAEPWKDHVVVHLSPLPGSVQIDHAAHRFGLREYFCPGCATVFEVEVSSPEDEPLRDTVTRWPD